MSYTFDKSTQLISINKELDTNVNKGAIIEVKNRIELEKRRGKSVVVSNLVEYFTKEPYGWEPLTINGIIVELWVYKFIDLEESGSRLSEPKEVGNYLVKSQTKTLERIVVLPKEEIDANLIKKVEKVAKECFGNSSVIGNDTPVEDLMALIQEKIGKANINKNECVRKNFPGKKAAEEWLEVLGDIKSIRATGEKVLNEFMRLQDDLEEAYDEYSKVEDFYNSPKKDKYEAGQKKVAEIERYIDYVGKIKESKAYLDLKGILDAKDPFNKIRFIEDHIAGILELEVAIVKEEIGELKRKADTSMDDFKRVIKERDNLIITANERIEAFKRDLDKELSIESLTKGKRLENIVEEIVQKYKREVREEILQLKLDVNEELKDKTDTSDLETRVNAEFNKTLDTLTRCKLREVESQLKIAISDKEQFIAEAQGKSKKKDRVSIKKVVVATSYNLEKEEDVEKYINKLEAELQEMKEKMLEAVRGNKIVDVK